MTRPELRTLPLFAVSLSLLVSGCATSLTLPVSGVVEETSETFTGSATGYADGGGTIQIVSNKGPTCSGKFVYVTRRNGEGVFRCSDGRSGAFKFVSTGTSGTGWGDFAGQRFTFIFG